MSKAHLTHVTRGSHSSGFNLKKSSFCLAQAGPKLKSLLPLLSSMWIIDMHYLDQYIICFFQIIVLTMTKICSYSLLDFYNMHFADNNIDVVNKIRNSQEYLKMILFSLDALELSISALYIQEKTYYWEID